MARENHTDEFRRRAVDLYESTPGATLLGIAADLGISRSALKEWVHRLGSAVATADNTKVTTVAGRSESHAARVIRLEAENARLTVEARKLATECDILRQAAKYLAGETNW